MVNASQVWLSVSLCLCKYRCDLSRCDQLNTLFIRSRWGGRQRSQSARCLMNFIIYELLHKTAGPVYFSLFDKDTLPLSVCVSFHPSTHTKLTNTSFLYLGGVQMGSLFAPAGSSTTFCKWLLCEHARGNTIKHTANNWKGAFVSHRSPQYEKKLLCDLQGLRVSTKGKWIGCVLPFASFKYLNTKSFRREIMLRGLQSKWDSPHENKFFQILGCEWVCVCVTSVEPAVISSCGAAAGASVSVWGWCASRKYAEEARRSNWVFLHPRTVFGKSGSCPI